MTSKIKSLNKIEAYRYLDQCGMGFIANVFLVGGGKNGETTLKALARLHQAGHEFNCASFMMPYERLIMDGKHVTPEEVRAAAKSL